MSSSAVLEGVLVATLILFSIFAFTINSSVHMTAFYGVPASGGISSSPYKDEISPVLGTDAIIFSPTRTPENVSSEDQQRALALLSAVVPSAPPSPSGVVPFALSAVGKGDSVVDPYRDSSVTFMDRDDSMILFVSSVSVPIWGFGDREEFSLQTAGQFSYGLYVFSAISSSKGRVLFRISGPLGSPVYFPCIQGVPNVYYDADTGTYLKVLLRGNTVVVWSRGD